MAYRSLAQCVDDLRRHGHLLIVDEEVDPRWELGEIQRRCYLNRSPAVLYTRVKGTRFPLLGNLFGTLDRARFIFRDTLELVKRAVELKIDPQAFLQRPTRYWRAPLTALHMRPQRTRRPAVLQHKCRLSDLPALVSWPRDGGPYITLPQVYTEDPRQPGWRKSNLGMYRVQLAGNDFVPDHEIGLHYQIHRGIGVHHQAALAAGQPLRVHIFVGGTPAMTLSAVMPLPEGLSELGFAGALAGHRIRIAPWQGSHVYADADFCLTGVIHPQAEKLEGPFGDHLGYYSLQHPFPVMQVEQVFHRPNAIWPFTVVGRPPQEDTTFGELIHEITGPILPTVLPGVKQVHAVDAAGVHPLLLALGSERYVPYRPTERPAELLTQAHAILGQGQLSLAKYLWILDQACAPELDLHDTEQFFQVLLARVDWRRDLHFQTETTIDTLDYSGTGFNVGSKVIVAATGQPLRQLGRELPAGIPWPHPFGEPRVCRPGILVLSGPALTPATSDLQHLLADRLSSYRELEAFPLVAVVDDSEFACRSWNNFLWNVFTRSNPATDICGVGAQTVHKHWGCSGSLIIDARSKPHHAPPLIEDPEISRRVDARAAAGGPLAKYL